MQQTNVHCDYSADVSKVLMGCDRWELAKERLAVNCTASKDKFINQDNSILRGHSGPVYSSCFTHDDQYLLSASEDTTGSFVYTVYNI